MSHFEIFKIVLERRHWVLLIACLTAITVYIYQWRTPYIYQSTAKVFIEDEKTFRIILTQGLNRQIRRMCFKCNVEVQVLKRIRIDHYLLKNLAPGELRSFNPGK